MENVTVSKQKLGLVIDDVEKLITHVEALVEDQDTIAKQRLADLKSGKVKGKSEVELDDYLRKRGVKVG